MGSIIVSCGDDRTKDTRIEPEEGGVILFFHDRATAHSPGESQHPPGEWISPLLKSSESLVFYALYMIIRLALLTTAPKGRSIPKPGGQFRLQST